LSAGFAISAARETSPEVSASTQPLYFPQRYRSLLTRIRSPAADPRPTPDAKEIACPVPQVCWFDVALHPAQSNARAPGSFSLAQAERTGLRAFGGHRVRRLGAYAASSATTSRQSAELFGATVLTEHAIQQVLPSATGFAARQAIAALRKQDIPIASLLRRAGLSEHDFDDRQHRISAAAQGKLLEYAADALGDAALGLHLAQQSNPREAGLLFYVASAAKTIGEGLTLYARYCRIVNEAVRPKGTRSPAGVSVQLHFVGLPTHLARQNVEFMIAASIKALREIAGRDICPTQVTFAHPRNSDLREFERFFGCPVEFGAPMDQLAFSNETLVLPLVTEDRHLLETLRASVEDEVQKLLPHGKAKRQIVARALGMSERTLSRKLTEERTTYDEIVDQLRRSLALQYIKDRGISLSQIAWLLGYEGSTSLNHAFVRWTGRPPSAARSEKLLIASSV
jgi:AraC-like DNA-binding protein